MTKSGLPDVKAKTPELRSQNPENSGIFLSKSRKKPGRFSGSFFIILLKSLFRSDQTLR